MFGSANHPGSSHFSKEKGGISKAKGIKPIKLTNKVNEAVRRDSKFADLVKTILKFAITFE